MSDDSIGTLLVAFRIFCVLDGILLLISPRLALRFLIGAVIMVVYLLAKLYTKDDGV